MRNGPQVQLQLQPRPLSLTQMPQSCPLTQMPQSCPLTQMQRSYLPLNINAIILAPIVHQCHNPNQLHKCHNPSPLAQMPFFILLHKLSMTWMCQSWWRCGCWVQSSASELTTANYVTYSFPCFGCCGGGFGFLVWKSLSSTPFKGVTMTLAFD